MYIGINSENSVFEKKTKKTYKTIVLIITGVFVTEIPRMTFHKG